MVKCEVLQDVVLSLKKGSIVFVDERQFELAKRVLKPVKTETKKKRKEEE